LDREGRQGKEEKGNEGKRKGDERKGKDDAIPPFRFSGYAQADRMNACREVV